MSDLQNKIDKAMELHAQGYNCAQCVAMVFADEAATDIDTAARATAGLGAGVGALGEICGVVTGMATVIGLKGDAEADAKKKANPIINALGKDFLNANGNLRCRDLKAPGAPKTCDQLIASGIRLLYNRLYPRQQA